MPKLKVAIISAGRMASMIDDEIQSMDRWPSLKRQLPYSHAPCYKEFGDEIEMVAICDLVEEKCKTFCERWDVPRYYLDYREMIEKEQPDPIPFASSHVELVRDLIHCTRTGGRPLANEIVARTGTELLMGVAHSHLAGGAAVVLPLANRRMYIPSH